MQRLNSHALIRVIPAIGWLKNYTFTTLINDFTAAVTVTILLIPQAIAYALLAGLPAEFGLYSCILPLLAYAFFGSSSTLSIGPAAITALMTATSVGIAVSAGLGDYITIAITLALLSGVLMFIMGILRLGFISNFLSHTVINGFISASAIIILLSQVKYLFGISAHGDTLLTLLPALWHNLPQTNGVALALGLAVGVFLYWAKKYAPSLYERMGMPKSRAAIAAKITAIFAIIASIIAVYFFKLDSHYMLKVTGNIPAGLPPIHWQLPSLALIKALIMPAFFISLIGYIQSLAVGKVLAKKRKEKLDANQELISLGIANMASSLSSGFPVTSSMSRSVVNYDAGALTQGASIMTAIGIALASLFLTPVLYYIPKTALAASIIVAVFSLIDWSIFKKTWRYTKSDFIAVTLTIVITLLFGVEMGISAGIIASITLHLYKASKPHIAEVGLLKGTQHFRNRNRHDVILLPYLLTLRPDESLYFVNASFLHDYIEDAIIERPQLKHIIIQCLAINDIDYSALDMLKSLNQQLADIGITLHLSEVKGPIMDRLKTTGLIHNLSGQVFLTQYEAFQFIKNNGT